MKKYGLVEITSAENFLTWLSRTQLAFCLLTEQLKIVRRVSNVAIAGLSFVEASGLLGDRPCCSNAVHAGLDRPRHSNGRIVLTLFIRAFLTH